MTKRSHTLQLYYASVAEAFSARLERLFSMKGKPGAEDIHEMRVAVKKITAVCVLLKELLPDRFHRKKQIRLFKPLFKSAGKVREQQVNLDLLESFSGSAFPQLVYALREKEKEAEMNLRSVLSSLQTTAFTAGLEKISEFVALTGMKTLAGASGKLLHKKHKRIRHASGKFRRNVHYIRKELKTMMVIATILRQSTGEEKLKKLIRRIKSNEKLLGRWHDHTILIRNLRQVMKSNPSPELRTLKDILKKSNKALFHQAHQQLRKF